MKPIIFSTPMIQAILEDAKTMTRRVMNPQPIMEDDGMWRWKDCQWMDGSLGFPTSGIDDHARYRPGDTLWVRETWGIGIQLTGGIIYKADYADKVAPLAEGERWRPSIHMPREVARLFLRVKSVRVEQVQDITEEDALTEGIRGCWAEPHGNTLPFIGSAKEFGDDLCHTRREAFSQLWDSLNAARGYGWEMNPWVWVYEFERCEKP